ncbi:hypothetical protein BH23ACT9_BH23ACT9_30270 [soil metagenome]
MDALVPVSLLDELLEAVAAAVHDHPMQSLVAGKLLLETGIDPSLRDELVDRGLESLAEAGSRVRQLMWALSGPSIRLTHIAVDTADAVSHLADLQVSVADDLDPEAAQAVVHALQAVLADALYGRSTILRLTINGDAEAVHAVLDCEGPRGTGGGERPEGPWLRLARARLAQAGGDMRRCIEAGMQRSHLTVPVAED